MTTSEYASERETTEGRVFTVTGGDWDRLTESVDPLSNEKIVVNMGPQHPSTHGVLRLVLELEGETVTECRPVVGYLHTGMEKTGEELTYLQGPTNATRMDYVSPLFNELVLSLATEKLLDVEMPVLDGPGMAYQMFLRDMGLEDVPVLFISGVANLRDVAASAGTPYFLGKPYRYEDIIAIVNRALAERIAPTREARP